MPSVEQLAAYYDSYDENSRLVKDRAHGVEFTTTLHVLDRYLTSRTQTILDVAAGTGRYAFHYARQGHPVTALDLVPKHVQAMTAKQAVAAKRAVAAKQAMAAKRATVPELPIVVLQGDARDLSRWYRQPFDVVLNMGPLYHLAEFAPRLECLRESMRVLQPDGILAFAYLNATVLASHPKGRPPFYGMPPEDAVKLAAELGLELLAHVAADGAAAEIGPSLNRLPEADFSRWLDLHLATCGTDAAIHGTLHAFVVCRQTSTGQVPS